MRRPLEGGAAGTLKASRQIDHKLRSKGAQRKNARTMRAVNAPVSGLTPYVRYAKSANAKAKLIEAAAKRAQPRVLQALMRDLAGL